MAGTRVDGGFVHRRVGGGGAVQHPGLTFPYDWTARSVKTLVCPTRRLYRENVHCGAVERRSRVPDGHRDLDLSLVWGSPSPRSVHKMLR